MNDRIFVDTNILVYAHDLSAARRGDLRHDKIATASERRLAMTVYCSAGL